MSRRQEFWAAQCPARGAGLSHAHWAKCNPQSYHPDTSDKHDWKQCCHCAMWEPIETEERPATREEPEPATADHLYVFTITGICARNQCGKREDAHPRVLKVNEPTIVDDECTVDHASIRVQRLIGDKGWQWTTCPVCGRQVEPKLATGEPAGKPWGPGRGPILDRLRKKLGYIKWLSDQGLPVGPERS